MDAHELKEGEVVCVQGSASAPYEVRLRGGIYSCTCPAWRNQSAPIERRTCKHLRKVRGDAVETARVGAPAGAASRPQAGKASGPAAAPPGAKETAPPVLLAHSWDGQQDPKGFWMSEKLDGVRAWWDGRAFLSRLGNTYCAPAWFRDGLPDHPLDGELWLGRKRFQECISIVRRQDESDDWKGVRFLIFDAPAREEPFEQRLAFLRERFGEGRLPYARFHEHERCRGVAHLKEELARVEALGGEGLMIREAGSLYQAGRSATLLKIKSFFDAEARVVGHLPGAGRHKGRVGALEVELPDGMRFAVGTGLSDKERESPPPVGATITFRYQELSRDGVPRFPSYLGVRDDVAWPAEDGPAPPRAAASGAAAEGALKCSPDAKPSVVEGRRFECTEGGAHKFWEIAVSGTGHSVTFGKVGSTGQKKLKEFSTEAAALADAQRLIAEKLRKGYLER